MPVLTASTKPAPSPKLCGKHQRARVQRLLDKEIDFVPHSDFQLEPAGMDDAVATVLAASSPSPAAGVELPTHLQRMCDSELLTPDQERMLFREMNLLKYRACQIRLQLAADPDHVDLAELQLAESLLAEAHRIRDHLIQANTRLVISIVKKFVTPLQSFDDLLSEGIIILMRAVEKFDFDRGFRFSTYAYRSIMRQAYRTVSLASKEEASFTRDAEEWAFAEEDQRPSEAVAEQAWSNVQELMDSLLERLDRRERFIIRSRYALGAHRQTRTFRFLAGKLGVSKERVRQLEGRAFAKLKTWAEEYGNEDLFAAALPRGG